MSNDKKKRQKHKARTARAAEIERRKREVEATESEESPYRLPAWLSKTRQKIRAVIGAYGRRASSTFEKKWPVVKALIWFVGLVGTTVATVSVFTGTFWPRSPIFVLPAPSNSLSSEVPFEIQNPSTFFDIKDLKLQCYIHYEEMYPIGDIYGGSFHQNQRIERVGNVPAEKSAQGRCNYDPHPIDVSVRKGEEPIGDDVAIRITRVWVSAYYAVSPWPWTWYRESSPEIFNWLDNLDPPRWVRGDQNSPSVKKIMKEPFYDWEKLRKEYEEYEKQQTADP